MVLLCLALGVAVIAGVGSLRAATDQGLATDGRRILGGDLEVESGAQALPTALRDWLTQHATRGCRRSCRCARCWWRRRASASWWS